MGYKSTSTICPRCGGDTKTIDTVINTDDNERYRRKRCIDCGRELFTTEHVVEADVSFIDNWHQYHRDKKRGEQRKLMRRNAKCL